MCATNAGTNHARVLVQTRAYVCPLLTGRQWYLCTACCMLSGPSVYRSDTHTHTHVAAARPALSLFALLPLVWQPAGFSESIAGDGAQKPRKVSPSSLWWPGRMVLCGISLGWAILTPAISRGRAIKCARAPLTTKAACRHASAVVTAYSGGMVNL